MQLAAQDEPGTEPGADGEEGEVVTLAGDAAPALAERGQVDVVLHRRREPDAVGHLRRERPALEARQVGETHRPGGRVDDARDADDDPVEARRQPARRADEGAGESLDGVERDLGVGCAQLHVPAREGGAAEVADGPAKEAGADVEPEHERGVGDRLEEDRAVARTPGALRRLAHEARVEERPKRERDRRLRDSDAARDLGAGDRRARANGFEDAALVQVLEQRRRRPLNFARIHHLVRNPNEDRPRAPG